MEPALSNLYIFSLSGLKIFEFQLFSEPFSGLKKDWDFFDKNLLWTMAVRQQLVRRGGNKWRLDHHGGRELIYLKHSLINIFWFQEHVSFQSVFDDLLFHFDKFEQVRNLPNKAY